MCKGTISYGIVLLILPAFIGTAAFRVSIPAIAFYAREVLSASAFSIGLLTSAFFATRVIAAVLAGILSSKTLQYLVTISFVINGFIVLLLAL